MSRAQHYLSASLKLQKWSWNGGWEWYFNTSWFVTSVAKCPTLICWAELLPLAVWCSTDSERVWLLHLYSTPWILEMAPINISCNIFLHMIFIANYIYEIGNTSNWEWYVRSLLLLGNHFRSKAANCYSVSDSSLNPWALLLELGNKTQVEMKVTLTCSGDKIQNFSIWMLSKLIRGK